ncbi:hypothetical protein PGB90_002691 [Kerria lacca]
MNWLLCVLLCSFSVSSIFVIVVGEDVKTKKNVSEKEGKYDIFINDEEGSGSSETKYDLESSGSGFGPDDEDAERASFIG